MAISLEQVIEVLNPDEPDYSSAATLGPEALPHLKTIIEGDDRGLAFKAAHLAGFIPGERAAGVLLSAARSRDAVVRVAAASAVRRLDERDREKLLLELLDDDDHGVRKFAQSAVPRNASPALQAKIRGLE
jgi:HEAT repeat protein